MKNFPPAAAMPSIKLVHRFLDATQPVINTSSVTGQHIAVACTALATADLKTALMNLDAAIATGFAQGFETRDPAAWIAAIARPMLRY